MKNPIKNPVIYKILRLIFCNFWVRILLPVITVWLLLFVFDISPLVFWLIYISEIIISRICVIYVSIISIFTKESRIKPIPENEFTEVIRELELDALRVKELGFEKISSSCREETAKIINYTFKHPEENIYWSLSYIFTGFRKILISSVFNEFNSNLYLGTTSATAIKMFLPERFYYHSVKVRDAEVLLNKHRKNMEVFIERGHTPIEIEIDDSYDSYTYYHQINKEINLNIIKVPFWALKMAFPIFSPESSKKNKSYSLPIREQLEKGIIKVPVI